jgi:diguanylate cyclase (GGDEF)-like protein
MGRKKNSDPEGSGAGALSQSSAQLLRKIERLEREVALARRFAYHDALTGLPNRSLMLDRLKQAVAQAIRQHKKVGVLLVDLDDFKKVNDELGHQAGDAILKSVAARLVSCIRVCDTACRYGGDEFVILLPEIASAEQLDRVKRKIREHLCRPHRLGRRNIVVGGSIGSALFREDAVSCAQLIGIADAAMYRAKRASREARPDPLRAAMGKGERIA